MGTVNFKMMACVFGGVVVAWLLVPIIFWLQTNTVAVAGPFGDMFGAINALFSGLAFAGLLLALLVCSGSCDCSGPSCACSAGS